MNNAKRSDMVLRKPYAEAEKVVESARALTSEIFFSGRGRDVYELLNLMLVTWDRDPEMFKQALIELRNCVWKREVQMSDEYFYKINSCLYKEYPVTKRVKL